MIFFYVVCYIYPLYYLYVPHLSYTLVNSFFYNLNTLFLYFFDPPEESFPDGVSLTKSNIYIPPGTHYTTMNNFANPKPNQATTSNDIIVQDSFTMVATLDIYIYIYIFFFFCIHCYLIYTPRAFFTFFCSNKEGYI